MKDNKTLSVFGKATLFVCSTICCV